MQLITHDAKRTIELGQIIGRLVRPGDVIVLTGDLGAGKTTLTKGLAMSLGITRIVRSPTFTIIREYRGGRLPLFHMDLYRLEDSSALDLGIEDYLDGDGVSVVEWPQFGKEVLPDDYLTVDLRTGEQPNWRTVTISGHGVHYQELAGQIKKQVPFD